MFPSTETMMAPEDRARPLAPDAPLVSGDGPMPLPDRIADLCSRPYDATAQARLRAIGEWLHGEGGVEMMRKASFDAFGVVYADDQGNREIFSDALHQAWAGVGDWRGRV